MDYIIRATAAEDSVRAFAAVTKELTEKARQTHKTSPVVTAALGRLLTAGAMMGVMLKGEKDLLTLTIRGDGPVQGLTVTADAEGRVKGFPYQNEVWIPRKPNGKLDVGGAVGQGTLTVVRDQGMKDPYSSQVQLQTGEIADDLTYYYVTSEQVPSSVGLGVLVDRDMTVRQAGGFILQLMPGAPDEVISRLEANLRSVSSVTEMLEEGLMPEQILERLLSGMDPEILEKRPAEFWCGCSRQRVEKVLISLGRQELETMIREGRPADLHCHFCNKDYSFSTEELKELLDKAGA